MIKSSSKRRFEYVEGSSDKFWETEVSGKDVLDRFGRNGTSGQSTNKTFADAAGAIRHAEKLVAEKTAKGYHEVQ